MRLFVALEISREVRENLAALMDELRGRIAQARWLRAENLHVTLKFMGEAGLEKMEGIRAALAGVRTVAPVEMEFRGLGCFPEARRARVLWVDAAAGPELARLAAGIEDALEPLEFGREQREFSSHLTVARFPQGPGDARKLQAALDEYGKRSHGRHTAREFCLYQSELQQGGSKYTRLACWPLNGAGDSA
ncbi:MAG: RNA 2',3'-cyclic phosphodiesterase [Acidobacteriia bacterium]|nr:RNA 2',3'-cyclic phosphodiesterase [Terriglobia bacterium]